MRKESRPDKPLISVITVVYNGASCLEQAIKSVLNQDYDNIEYLIIDGGSSDETLDIIRKYEERIDYWISESDNGIYDAMNKGIRLASGVLIGLLNSDDWYEQGALHRVADAFINLTENKMIVGDAYIIQEEMRIRYRVASNQNFWRGLPFPHQALFVPKAVYQNVGMYDLRYLLSSDYDFLLRCVSAGVTLKHLGHVLVNYRLAGQSNRKPMVTLNESRVINKRYFGFMSIPHWKFLVLFSKSAILEALQIIIRFFFGERLLKKARSVYMKLIIARGFEQF
jgi:glycosyltransferase involved in cell wall biosynthesis